MEGRVKTVYTFGYQGFTIDELQAKARELGAIVIDTRKTAYSRYPGWGMKALATRFGWDGYRYFGGMFGNVNYKTPGAGIKLADPVKGLAEIQPILDAQPIILLCGCWSFATCHRTTVAALIRETFGNPVVHLTRANMPKDAKPAEDTNQLKMF